MNTEKLINCVYNRPPLWDKSDKRYHLRDVAKELWCEVSREMGMGDTGKQYIDYTYCYFNFHLNRLPGLFFMPPTTTRM